MQVGRTLVRRALVGRTRIGRTLVGREQVGRLIPLLTQTNRDPIGRKSAGLDAERSTSRDVSVFPPPRLVTRDMRADVDDLLEHPVFLETRYELHHNVRKSDHLLRASRYAWMLAGVVNADRRICARAGLLHDLHSRLGSWSTHGSIAASVANDIGESQDVCDAIVPHMFPLGPAPKTREGWVLTVADKAASVADALSFAANVFSGQSMANRRKLRASDRYLQH